MQPYQSTKKTQLVLDVDQYSSVTVNEKMIRFMNVLYKKNRREKPTWKAKRAKHRLTQWKEKDSKHFDKGDDHQPMDIIDVTEFIKDNR